MDGGSNPSRVSLLSYLSVLCKTNKNISGCNSMVECQPSKLNVVGSSPIARSKV